MQNFKIGQVVWSISDNRPCPATVVKVSTEYGHTEYLLSSNNWVRDFADDTYATSAEAWDRIEKRTSKQRAQLVKHLEGHDETTAIVAKARAAWDDTKAQSDVLAAAVMRAQDSVDDAEHELTACQEHLEECLRAQSDFMESRDRQPAMPVTAIDKFLQNQPSL